MKKHEFLLSPYRFFIKMLKHFNIALLIIFISLAIGAIGYGLTEKMPWLDATLNAAMILTGMGPVSAMQTTTGKIFAIFYSLFSGVIFITILAIILGPVAHRFLKRFHLETQSLED